MKNFEERWFRRFLRPIFIVRFDVRTGNHGRLLDIPCDCPFLVLLSFLLFEMDGQLHGIYFLLRNQHTCATAGQDKVNSMKKGSHQIEQRQYGGRAH